MKQYLYSPSTKGFYLRGFHSQIPSDARDVTKDERAQLMAAERIAPKLQELRDAAKAELRTMRAPMLDALTGIAGRAERAGNDALASEADALAEQLLDITDDAALNSATTYEDMQAAGVAAYKRMAAGTSPALASVFKEITGA